MTMWNKLTKTMKMAIIFKQNKKMKLFFCNFFYFRHKILSTVPKYNKRYWIRLGIVKTNKGLSLSWMSEDWETMIWHKISISEKDFCHVHYHKLSCTLHTLQFAIVSSVTTFYYQKRIILCWIEEKYIGNGNYDRNNKTLVVSYKSKILTNCIF